MYGILHAQPIIHLTIVLHPQLISLAQPHLPIYSYLFIFTHSPSLTHLTHSSLRIQPRLPICIYITIHSPYFTHHHPVSPVPPRHWLLPPYSPSPIIPFLYLFLPSVSNFDIIHPPSHFFTRHRLLHPLSLLFIHFQHHSSTFTLLIHHHISSPTAALLYLLSPSFAHYHPFILRHYPESTLG